VLVVIGSIALVGCSKEEEEKKPVDLTPSTAMDKIKSGVEEGVAKVTAEMEAKLKEADALDGKTDKIITRCATCKLGMDGSKDNNVQVAGYTLYFCTGKCKDGFAKDIEKSVLAMEIPKE
jgi:hypothetical protein